VEEGAAELRWAPRVSRTSIRRLYESDAAGRLDEELLDQVFFAFLARCRSILTVSAAAAGRATCPRCRTVIERRAALTLAEKGETITCPSCGWQTTWAAYHRSYQHKQLMGGNALPVFQEFDRRAMAASSARDKMLLVDWIVHEAHKTLVAGQREYHRPTAVNLIEGRMRELLVFLDDLAYGPASTPGLREQADRWQTSVRPRLGRKGLYPVE
jgi:predicted RNA-binding Zn-ribbon protein involved in translation (DUF1610 family)